MSLENREIPKVKVFISYSWTNPEHEEWVLELATRLRENGVDVKLDKWDLKEGQDIYAFMESMVTSDEINKVLIICDKGYMEKSEKRKGGVGTEAQIITPEVYSDVDQEKFIPIICERGLNGETFIPTYIKSRKYIDMSSHENYESGYELLLRNLFQRPQYRKPALGNPPDWLFEEEAIHYKTTNIIKQIKGAAYSNPSSIKGFTKSFFEAFFESFEQFELNYDSESNIHLDEKITNAIEKMLPIRNDYINFIEFLCGITDKINSEILIEFFEQMYKFTQPEGNIRSEDQTEHYKFIIHELFVYTLMILIENKQYESTAELLENEYYIKDYYHHQAIHTKFSIFCFEYPNIDIERKKRLNSNRLSIAAETFINRANLKKYPKEKFISADLILHYYSVMNQNENEYNIWFPYTYVYGRYLKIDFLQRLISKKYFEKVKIIFSVTNPEELRVKFKKYDERQYGGYSNGGSKIQNINFHITPEQICTIK